MNWLEIAASLLVVFLAAVVIGFLVWLDRRLQKIVDEFDRVRARLTPLAPKVQPSAEDEGQS